MDADNYYAEKLTKALQLGHITELKCDTCGKHLGFVFEFDLNGSYFFCQDCVDKAKASAIKPPRSKSSLPGERLQGA